MTSTSYEMLKRGHRHDTETHGTFSVHADVMATVKNTAHSHIPVLTNMPIINRYVSCNPMTTCFCIRRAEDEMAAKGYDLHGPSVTDHSTEKPRYSGYWEERLDKLSRIVVDEPVYRTLIRRTSSNDTVPASAHISPNASRSAITPQQSGSGHCSLGAPSPSAVAVDSTSDFTPALTADGSSTKSAALPSISGSTESSSSERAPPIFRGCCVHFNGRTGDISALHLAKLVRLHGGSMTPHFTMRKVTHVVCTNLSGSKFQKALKQPGAAAPRLVTPGRCVFMA